MQLSVSNLNRIVSIQLSVSNLYRIVSIQLSVSNLYRIVLIQPNVSNLYTQRIILQQYADVWNLLRNEASLPLGHQQLLTPFTDVACMLKIVFNSLSTHPKKQVLKYSCSNKLPQTFNKTAAISLTLRYCSISNLMTKTLQFLNKIH